MKKNLLLVAIAICACNFVFAQVPQAVPYQAVARNAAGNLVSNQNISVRLSIINSTAAGPVVYQEKHTVTTNQFGLFTVNIGQGAILSGTFPGINWAVNAKYLKVEFDPAGGNSFVNMGTSQLLSVPYALFAGNGSNIPNGTAAGNTLRWDGTKWIADNALYNNGLKIGLGTTVPGSGPNPSTKLDIRDEDGNNSDINQTVAGAGFPALIWTKQAGTLAAPSTIAPNTFLGGVQGSYYNGTDFNTGAAMYYVADTTIGNWHPASIQFRTTAFGNNSNLTRMIIKHNGNVGIGTATPVAKLDVIGKLRIQDGTEGLNKVFTSDVNGIGSWKVAPTSNVPNGIMPGNTLRWNGTAWIADNAIYSDGTRVGLGTTQPGSGVNASSAKIDLRDEDGNNSDISQTVAGAGFPALIWAKQLGTLATPAAVTKNTFVGGIQGSYFNGSNYNIGAAMYYIADTTSATSFPASIQFRTTSVDSTRNLTRMIIKHNGKVGIGTTIPGVNGYNPYARLDIRDEDGSNSDINQMVAGGGIPAITWAQQGGTLAAPQPIAANSVFGRLDGNYYTATGYSQGNARAASIFFRADTAVNSGNPGSIYFATTKYGQTVPVTNLIIKHNGNVGVGTQNPEQKFDVRGKVKILDGTEGNGKVFTSDATGVGSWQTLPAGNVPNGTLLGNTLRWNGTAWIADNAIYSDGSKIGLGTTTPGTGNNFSAKIDLQDEDGNNSDISQTVAGAGFPALVWTKQKGTLAAPTAVTKNTFLGGIQGSYFNGTGYNVGAAMYYIADTISATSFPASIQFRTTSVDSTRNLTRLIIKHDGKVGIGTITPGVNGYNPYARLDIRDEDGSSSDINQMVAGGGIPAITWAQQRGTLAAPLPIVTNSVFGRLDGNYYTANGYSQGNSRAASIFFRADTAVNSGNPGSIYFATAKYGDTIPTTNLIIKHNGNVGIGTQLPERKLDIRGGVKIVDGTQGAGKVLTSDGAGNASWQTPAPVVSGGEQHVAFFAGDEPVADQNIATNNVATISFGQGYAYFNDGAGYSTASNHFTAPVAGVYQLNATVNVQGTAGSIVQVFLRNVAGHVVRGEQTIPTGGLAVITLNATVNTNVSGNDFWIEAVSSAPLTIRKYQSGFSGHLVYAIAQAQSQALITLKSDMK